MPRPTLLPTCPSMLLALALAGCGGLGSAPPQPRLYDLGLAPHPAQASPVVGAVQVTAPSWLRGSGMQYRLAEAAPGERRTYTESRWAAPPPELLGGVLSRSLAGTGHCRLEVDLDEFVQNFPAAGPSEGLLEARVRLRGVADGGVLAGRPLSLRVAAPSADAAGGVAALTTASRDLAGELAAWLGALERHPQHGPRLREACARS